MARVATRRALLNTSASNIPVVNINFGSNIYSVQGVNYPSFISMPGATYSGGVTVGNSTTIPRADGTYKVQYARTNYIRNTTNVGVATGSPGTVPNNWAAVFFGGTGTTTTNAITGFGTEYGMSYIEFHFAGTGTTGYGIGFSAEQNTQVPGLQGQTWCGSWYTRLTGGSTAGIANIGSGVQIVERNSGGTALNSASSNVLPTTSLTRDTISYTFPDATSAYATIKYQLTITNGQSFDITFRVYAPQLEQVIDPNITYPTAYIPTLGSAAVTVNDIRISTPSSITNLVPNSSTTSSTTWIPNQVSKTTGQTDPLGGTGAALVTADGTSNPHYLIAGNASVNYTAGTIYTFSRMVKAGTQSLVQLTPSPTYFGTAYANFDLSGIAVTASSGLAAPATITAIGGGWYRISIAALCTTTTTGSYGGLVAFISSGSDGRSPTNTLTTNFYDFGAMVDPSPVLRPYVVTTSDAKTVDDYTAVRGNLVVASNSWSTNPGSMTVTTGATAPDGTSTAFTFTGLVADSNIGTAISYIPNVKHTGSIWIRAHSGTPTINVYFNGSGGLVANFPATLSTSWQQFTFSGVMPASGTESLQIGGGSSFGVGLVVDVWHQQVEPVLYTNATYANSTIAFSYPTAYIPTTSAPVYVYDTLLGGPGAFVEEASTNSVANSTGTGAVAGTPGTLPTAWNLGGVASGIALNVIGTGTEYGLPYTDLQWVGTATGTSGYGVFFTAANSVSATSGQTWTSSLGYRVVGGSLANVNAVTNGIYGKNSSFVTEESALATLTPTSVLQRTPVETFTLANALTTQVDNAIIVNFTNGAVINLTLRIYAPQLEQKAYSTSPILTSGTTITRNADNPNISGLNIGTTPSLFGLVSGINPNNIGTHYPTWARLYLNGTNFLIMFSQGGTVNVNCNETINGTIVVNNTLKTNVFTAGGMGKAAYAIPGNTTMTTSAAGVSGTTLSGAGVIPFTQLQLGNSGTDYLNGNIGQITLYSKPLNQSQLNVLTQ